MAAEAVVAAEAVAEVTHAAEAVVQEAVTKAAEATKADATVVSAAALPTDVTARNPGDARRQTVTHVRRNINLFD